MKNIRKIICLLAVLVMMLATTVAASAGTVTYKNQAEKFIFEPGSVYSKTDLFGDQFKGVMPGDKITDTVTVKNEASDDVTVEIFMRALGASDLQNPEDGIAEVSAEDSADFLEEMTLTVVQRGDSTLFEAPADQTAQLTDWVSLGEFASGATVDLDITLNVPLTMGNDCQKKIGALDWQFKVVETPVPEETIPPTTEQPTEKPPVTQTGDDFNMLIPAAVLIVAMAAILLALFGKRRKEEQ